VVERRGKKRGRKGKKRKREEETGWRRSVVHIHGDDDTVGRAHTRLAEE